MLSRALYFIRTQHHFKKKYIFRALVILVLLLSLFFTIKTALESQVSEPDEDSHFINSFKQSITRAMSLSFMPILSFLDASPTPSDPLGFVEASLHKRFPVYYYMEYLAAADLETEDANTKDLIIRQEGMDEDYKNIAESELDYEDNALHIENSLAQSMLDENNRRSDDSSSQANQNSELLSSSTPFVLQEHPVFTYDWAQSWEYNELISNFFAVDTTTSVSEDLVSLDSLIRKDMTISKDTAGPQILIYHTHASEAFADSIPGDASTTIVGAGERLATLLRDEYGFNVLHHTGEYDTEKRDYAYTNALPEIEKILEENPSIEVVIDLHRDAMSEENKLLIDLNGRPTAKFMFFNGLSRTKQTGDISYLPNPYIEDNLAFSFQAQIAANEYYPGITRKIYLKAYRYNMHVAPKSMLIELGAQNNTVEEIMNACDPLAHVLSLVLAGSS